MSEFIPIDFHFKNRFVSLNLDSISINHLVITEKRVSFVPGTNDLQLKVSGVDADISLYGTITILDYFQVIFDAT